MDTIDALLASTGGGLDQPAIAWRGHRNRYLGFGRLISGSGVIFPGSHRISRARQRVGCMPLLGVDVRPVLILAQ